VDHSGGGLVVVAIDETHARELIDVEAAKAAVPYDSDREPVPSVTAEEWKQVRVLRLHPEDDGSTLSEVIVFPDAGCC
jgi:hypothetical protein